MFETKSDKKISKGISARTETAKNEKKITSPCSFNNHRSETNKQMKQQAQISSAMKDSRSANPINVFK